MASFFEKLILVKLECSNSTYKAEARRHILYVRALLFNKLIRIQVMIYCFPVRGFMPVSDSDVFVLGNV